MFLTTDETYLEALDTETLIRRLDLMRRWRDPLRYRVALKNVLTDRGIPA